MRSLLPFLSLFLCNFFFYCQSSRFFALSLLFSSLTYVCFSLFSSCFFFRDSWICGLLSFIKFRTFLLITSSYISYGSLPTSGTPSKNMLDHLLLSHLLVVLPLFLFSPFVSVWIISMDLSIGSFFPMLCSFC